MSKCVDVRLPGAYSNLVADKDATGFSSPKLTVADDRQQAVFFRPHHRASYGAAVMGRLRPAGFHCHRSANPVTCRSTPFSSGRAVHQPTMEAHMPGTNSPELSHSEQISARRDEIAKRYPTLSKAEATLLAAFRAASDDARADMVAMSVSIAKGSPRQRPALTLVRGAQRQFGEVV